MLYTVSVGPQYLCINIGFIDARSLFQIALGLVKRIRHKT